MTAVVAAALVIAACGSDAARVETAATTTGATRASTTAPSTTNAPTGTDTPDAPTTTTPDTTTPDTRLPTTTLAPTTTDIVAERSGPPPGCVRVDDFDADLATWFIVNDGVMGGRSDGRSAIADSVLTFSGTVVTEGGGFTSVRLRLDEGELAGSERVVLRVRADDRVYGLTYEDDEAVQGRRVAHVAALRTDQPVDDDGFQIVELPHAALQPSIFGRAVDTAAFDPAQAREIGVIIADGVDGDFALDIDWIDACP